ncbi:MAG: hypothetical protein HYY06_12455 [Deltaproteobacteria bacterium]|nr:hypothetical protein [Deltaproteobacteria bacterium]
MRVRVLVAACTAALVAGLAALPDTRAYPPAVGIVGPSRDCLACHTQSGSWGDQRHTIIDLLDANTRASLRQRDGSFLIQVARGERRTIVTVIGRAAGDRSPPPERNAWHYVDPTQLATSSISRFAPGWDVSLPMSCRLVGDSVPEYVGARVTSLPMTVRPGDAARDATIELQVMLTAGQSVKGSAIEGMRSSYHVRHVRLRVVDPPTTPIPAAPPVPAPPRPGRRP